MRRSTRVLLTVVTAVLVTAGSPFRVAEAGQPLAGPATPTSVRLTVPGTTGSLTLSYTRPAYEALADLVGARESAERGAGGPGVDAIRSVGVTLTWLHHRAEPWRVDRVWLTDDDGVWIATRVAQGADSVRRAVQRWHRPDDPDRLVALLQELGVAPAARGGGRLFPDVAGRAGGRAVVGPVPATAVPADVWEAMRSSGDGPSTWTVAVGGAGLLLLAGIVSVRRRRTSAGPEGDVPAADEAPPGTEWLSR